MKTRVFQSVNGPVARVPIFLRDRPRSFRRLRPVLGRNPVALSTGSGFTVYAKQSSVAAHIHFIRLARLVS